MKIFSNRWILTTFWSIICVLSIGTLFWVANTVVPTSTVREQYENVAEYHFVPLANNETLLIEASSSKATISWDNLEEVFYVTSFDGGVNGMPSEVFQNLAAIPGGTKSIQLDISVRGKYYSDLKDGVDLILYLATYDENGQVTINSVIPEVFNERERARNISLSVDTKDTSKFFKILLRISPRHGVSTEGFIEVSKIDVIFK